jgi:hypothetical protein
MAAAGYLGDYLKNEIFPRLAAGPYGDIEESSICRHRPVFLYRENHQHLSVVGKPYQFGSMPGAHAWAHAEREFENLRLLRDDFGMGEDQFQVVRPLGKNALLSSLVVVGFAPGKPLEHYICKTIYDGQGYRLYDKLGKLAAFFRKLHYNTGIAREVSLGLPQWYLDRVLENLGRWSPGQNESQSLRHTAADWFYRHDMLEDNEVIVHGDATPTNFLFDNDRVTAIDLEKMKRADRCWDLGFVAAELRHHFLWRTGDASRAEPFIGHFLWEYAGPDMEFFRRITRRLPFFMALGFLRIARNSWLGDNYRRMLLREATACLQYRP